MYAALAVTTTRDALDAAAQVLLHSLQRGDFDDDLDFDDAASLAATRLDAAARLTDADSTDDHISRVVLDTEHLDEILAVLGSDIEAERGPLARFIRDTDAAYDAA